MKGFDSIAFALAVKHHRARRPLRSVAEASGVSASTLLRIESGKTPDVDSLMLLCSWMGCPADRFRSEEADKIGEVAVTFDDEYELKNHLRTSEEDGWLLKSLRYENGAGTAVFLRFGKGGGAG